MSLKSALVRKASRLLQKRSNTSGVNWLRRIAYAVYRATYSPNYHMDTNGELRALGIVAPRVDDKVIFDVGANVGEWSLAAAGLPGVTQVYAFEPARKTYARLADATKAAPSISCFNLGLSQESGPLEILYSERNPEKSSVEARAAGSLLSGRISDFAPESQMFIRGDDFCDRHGIDRIAFLKIDTEGHDLQALRGFAGRLADGRITCIQFEYNRLNLYTRHLLLDFYDLLNPPSRPNNYLIGRVYPQSVDFKQYDYVDENFIDGNFIAVLSSEDKLIEALRGAGEGRLAAT